MIFKTFNSDIDNMSSRWGMFGKSFSDIGNTITTKWKQVTDYIAVTNDATISGMMSAWKGTSPVQFLSDDSIVNILNDYNKALDAGAEKTAKFLDAGTGNDFMDGWLKQLNGAPATMNDYKAAVAKAESAQNGLTTSMVASKVAALALNVAISMGVSIAISALIKLVDNLIHANEKAIEKAEKLRDKYNDFKETNASNIKTLNDLKDEFEKLSDGVSQYGDNISLTTEQYARYQEIVQQIVGMSPSLAEGYDTENGYIADKNKLLERAIELQEIEYRNELRKRTNLTGDLKTSMKGHIAEYKKSLDDGKSNTSFSNALWEVFNTNNRDNYDGQSMARDIMESLGVKDIDKEIEKYISKYGYWQNDKFWNDYCDKIVSNLDVVTNSLTAEEVGLDDTVFDQNIEKLESYAEQYSDVKDSVKSANESIQTDLGYIAEYADGYSDLSKEQQKFVTDYLKGFDISDITSENSMGILEYDEDKMASVKSQIKKFVEELSHDDSTKQALTDLYAPPSDNETIEEYKNRIDSSLEVIRKYCEANGIEIPVGIGDVEDSATSLESSYKQTIENAKEKYGEDLTPFFKENSINTQEEIDKWREIAQSCDTATEAKKKYLEAGTSNENQLSFSLSEDQSKAIDDFQSKVKTLSSALSTLQLGGELDGGTFTDLMQEFPSLSEESDNLEEAIKSLIEDALKKLYSTLGENLPDNYKNSLKEIADEALNTKASLKDALSDIQKSYDVVYDFKEAMSDNGITDSLLNSVASLSDELNTLVAGFYAGAVSAEQLFSAISEQYDTDLQNYSNTLIEKNALNSEFYSNVGLSSTEVINHFRDDYGVDIENCKSYAALKAKIELETLGKIARKWSDYYDLQTQQLTEKAKYLQNQADHLSGNAKMKFYSDTGLGEMLNELEEESSRYKEMMDYINNITYEGIDSSFDKISTKLKEVSNSSSNSSSSSKDSTTEIDWIQRKVDVLSDALDELKNKLDGALTSKEKRTILDDEIEKAKELRDVYTEGAKKYEDAANSYAKSNSSVLSKEIISKIKGGTSLSKLGIEDFSSENAEIVNNYIKLWDNYKEFEKLQTEIDNDIADYEEQKRQTVIDDFNDKYDLLKHNLEMGYISEKEYYVSLRKLNEKYYSDKEKYGDEYKQYEEEIYKGLQSYYKSYCDDMMTYYQKSLEANKISFKKYSKNVAKFLKDMFNQGKISAKDYYDYLEQFYQEKKDIYDKVLSAVENRFNKEIDKIDDQIDKINDSNDALEEQKTLYENAASAVVDYYDKLIDNENDLIDSVEEVNDNIQDQIDKYDSLINVADRLYEEEQNRLEDQKDAIQDKIDLINDENDAKDLQYRKEQALYELERSQQQRTKKLYVGDKGFIYDTDKSAISDAKKNVEDIRTEELISSLEKEKDALDDSIDALQKYRDALSEISDAYNKLVDERNAMELIGANYKDIIFGTSVEDWDKLKDKYISAKDEITDNENLIKSYEEKIKVWEKEKEQWSSLTDVISQQERKQAANQLLGANWKQQINNGVLNSFDGFKDKYLQIQSKINSNDELIESLNEKKSHYEDLKQQWSDLTSAYEDSVNEQYTASVLGANWESKILSGRLSTLNNFKDEYIKIQKEIANAQVQAAQAQVKADTTFSSKPTSSNSNVKKAQDAVEKARFLANKIINKKAASSHKGLIVNAYETGTKNAKKGINLVGEGKSGAETYVDNHGNIALVTEPTLIPMEGGETVYNGEETKKMLSMRGLVPVESIGGVDINEITKQLGNMPFSMPDFDNKNISKPSVSNVSNTQSIVIGDIHLHGVQNVPDFGKALKEALPGISVQFNGRH